MEAIGKVSIGQKQGMGRVTVTLDFPLHTPSHTTICTKEN
jgi:hypothetical protein